MNTETTQEITPMDDDMPTPGQWLLSVALMGPIAGAALVGEITVIQDVQHGRVLDSSFGVGLAVMSSAIVCLHVGRYARSRRAFWGAVVALDGMLRRVRAWRVLDRWLGLAGARVGVMLAWFDTWMERQDARLTAWIQGTVWSRLGVWGRRWTQVMRGTDHDTGASPSRQEQPDDR